MGVSDIYPEMKSPDDASVSLGQHPTTFADTTITDTAPPEVSSRTIASLAGRLERLDLHDAPKPPLRAAEQRILELEAELRLLKERSMHGRSVMSSGFPPELTDALTVIASATRSRGDDRDDPKYRLRLRADVRKTLPEFDGDLQLDAWWQAALRCLQECAIREESERLILLRSALTGKALEFMGALEDHEQPRDLLELYQALQARFGKSVETRLSDFDDLEQGNRTIREHYDAVQRAAIGLHKDPVEIVQKFLRTLRSPEIQLALLNQRFRDLREAMEAAERYEQAQRRLRDRPRRSTTDRSSGYPTATSKTVICRNCGKSGHIARNCKSKPKAAVKKVAHVEVETDEEDCQDCYEVDCESDSSETDMEDKTMDCDEKRRLEDIPSSDPKRQRADMRDVPIHTGGSYPVNAAPPQAGRPAFRARLPNYGRQTSLGRVDRTMQQKVDVPVELLSGLVLSQAQDPEQLGRAWASKAGKDVRRYAQNFETNVVELVPPATVSQVEHLQPLSQPTFHVAVRFPEVQRTQYALVDPGSQVTLMSTGLAAALQLIEEDRSNVYPAGFKVKGVGGAAVQCASIHTELQLGRAGERFMPIIMCLLPTLEYKIILGQDLLLPLEYSLLSKQRVLQVNHLANNPQRPVGLALNLLTKEEVESKTAVRTYQAAVANRQQPPSPIEASAVESALSLAAGADPDAPEVAEILQWQVCNSQSDVYNADSAVAYCDAVEEAVNQDVMPPNQNMGALGHGELTSRHTPELSPEELTTFLTLHSLEDGGSSTMPLAQRAWRLQQGLMQNPAMLCPTLKEEEKQQLKQMLLDAADILAVRVEDLLVPAKVPPLRVPTIGPPFRAKPYRQSREELDFLKETCTAMEKVGIIERSCSAWALPCFVAYRKALGKKIKGGKMRKVVDCRPLNAVSPNDSYPLPSLEGTLDKLEAAEYLGAVDLKSGYWQVPVADEDAEKFAFITGFGLFHYRRALMGYKNAPAHFCRCIDVLLAAEHLGPEHAAFMDDITTAGPDFPTYLASQGELFAALRRRHWLIAADKLRLGYRRVVVLGWLVGGRCRAPDPKKVEGIEKLQPPHDATGVKTFLGAAGWYRELIPRFAHIAQPLHQLLKKDVDFVWGPEQEGAWTALKQALMSSPVLRLPRAEGLYKLYTDFSAIGISAVLHQVQDGEEFPICYKSRGCRGAETSYSSAEGELLAAVWGIGKVRHYIATRPFVLITDSRALAGIQTTRNLTGKIARWALYLQEFQFTVEHKAGKMHGNADGTSRGPLPQEQEEPFDQQLAEVWTTVITELEDPDSWLDEEEQVVDSAPPLHNTSSLIVDCNVARKEHVRASKCESCGVIVGDHRSVCCGRCRKVRHLRCLPHRPPSTYWYCEDCKDELQHHDPAQDLPLQRLLVDGTIPAGMSDSQAAELREEFMMVRGQLVRNVNGQRRLVPAPAERGHIVEEVHEMLQHAGAEKTATYLEQHYWWPSMRADARCFCESCLPCQMQTAVFHRRDVITRHLVARKPRASWSLDCAPRLGTQTGNRLSIIVAVDDFSKFVVIGTLEELNSTTTAQWFLENVVARFGKPDQVRVDNGNEWRGHFKELTSQLGIHQRTTRPHAPWQNGRVERMIRQIKSLVRRVMLESPEADWAELLPYIAWAINATVSRSTGHAPFTIFFGEDPSPLQSNEVPIMDRELADATSAELQRFASKLRQEMKALQEEAANREAAYRATLNAQYPGYEVRNTDPESFARIRGSTATFAPGAFVLCKRPRTGPWSVKSAGPYIVLGEQGHSLRLQALATGREVIEDKANCKLLKGWIRIPTQEHGSP